MGRRKKYIVSALCVLLTALCCTACSRNPEIEVLSPGETFQSTAALKEGCLDYMVSNIQYSDDITDFGIGPEEIRDDGQAGTYYEGQTMVSVDPAIDLTTGRLADHFLFVLMDITVTNVNAVSYEGKDGTAFCIDALDACDTSVPLKKEESFPAWSYAYSSGTGGYDAEEQGTNGSNYFLLPAGESLTYQVGFIVGNAGNDFSGVCITDRSGSYHSGEAVFVSLGLPGAD